MQSFAIALTEPLFQTGDKEKTSAGSQGVPLSRHGDGGGEWPASIQDMFAAAHAHVRLLDLPAA